MELTGGPGRIWSRTSGKRKTLPRVQNGRLARRVTGEAVLGKFLTPAIPHQFCPHLFSDVTALESPLPDINHSQTGMIGVTRVQTFIDSDGRRSSAATAYLTEDVCRRENLKISVGMTVVRIITHTAAGSKPVARGVELASGPCVSIRYRVKATRDIIIACGTVHTPQLLKLSGIGPESELTHHDIKVVKDLPGVGANLQVNEL
jgi:choline dehydrogenase